MSAWNSPENQPQDSSLEEAASTAGIHRVKVTDRRTNDQPEVIKAAGRVRRLARTAGMSVHVRRLGGSLLVVTKAAAR